VEREQTDKLAAWFDNYVAGFYGDDDYANANFKLKEEHSHRVCGEMLYLADELGLSANQKAIAEVIALLHDVGRFEQFEKYRTYNDVRSVNHCLLGLEVLACAEVLGGIDAAERQLIEKAIEYHGLKELPAGLPDDWLLFARLLRDADKLDVLFVVTTYLKQYTHNPDEFMLEMEFPDEPCCSAEVVEAILNEQLIDYSSLRTLNDFKLMQLGWVYDVNFTATLSRIKQRGFLETLLGFLPDTQQVCKVREKILAYVGSRFRRQV